MAPNPCLTRYLPIRTRLTNDSSSAAHADAKQSPQTRHGELCFKWRQGGVAFSQQLPRATATSLPNGGPVPISPAGTACLGRLLLDRGIWGKVVYMCQPD